MSATERPFAPPTLASESRDRLLARGDFEAIWERDLDSGAAAEHAGLRRIAIIEHARLAGRDTHFIRREIDDCRAGAEAKYRRRRRTSGTDAREDCNPLPGFRAEVVRSEPIEVAERDRA